MEEEAPGDVAAKDSAEIQVAPELQPASDLHSTIDTILKPASFETSEASSALPPHGEDHASHDPSVEPHAEVTAPEDKEKSEDPIPLPESIAVIGDHTGEQPTITDEGVSPPPQEQAIPTTQGNDSQGEAAEAASLITPGVVEESPIIASETSVKPHGEDEATAPPPPGPDSMLSEASGVVAAVEAEVEVAEGRPPVGEPRKAELRVAAIDGVYDKGAFGPPVDLENELPRDAAPTVQILSLESHKRNNLAYIEDDVLVTTAGNNIVFINLADMSHKYMPGIDGGGIGAVAVHPSRKFLAVAEKCRHRSPNVYVYSYPQLVLVKVMREGTERAYSSLAFNDKGDMLASVGSYPDYLLTLWNWEEEAIVLRSKAFSQDVYTIKFSPYFDGILNSCGTGHIRFWKMASTFTGLKLQGQLGKFGNVELTDVVGFVEMPDGKVLGTTETGELLMWDGGLIKVVLHRPQRRPCHDGAIHVLLHDRTSNVILSGGADGYVRLWSFTKINEAEADEDTNSTAITPLEELLIAPGARIKSIIWERQHWIVMDEAGALYKVVLPDAGSAGAVTLKGAAVTRLVEFHSGGIVGMHLSNRAHVTVTTGVDGSLRVWDYEQARSGAGRLVHTLKFNMGATAVTELGVDGATAFAVGFRDGVVRLVRRCKDGLALVAAAKPHKGRVLALALSPDGRQLASAGEDGTVFFFTPTQGHSDFTAGSGLGSVAFTSVLGGGVKVICMVWAQDNRSVLLGTSGGTVIEVQAPEPGAIDTSKTFEVTGLLGRMYTFRAPKPPKKVKKKAPPVTEEGAGADDSAATPPADGTAPVGDGAQEATPLEDDEEEEIEENEEVAEELVVEVLTMQLVSDGSGDMLLTVSGAASSGTIWRCNFDRQGPEDTAKPYGPACAGPTSQASEGTEGAAVAVPSATSYFRYGLGPGNTPLALMGSVDGLVRVQRCAAPGSVPEGKPWQAPLHDMLDGRVTAVAISFDGAFLLSAAMDGTLYVQASDGIVPGSPPAPKPSSPEPHLVSVSEAAATTVVDITNPGEYTLEEAKQKAELDALLAQAEAKKKGVREHLAEIRAEFEKLLSENAAKPEAERLPRSHFEIDPGLKEMMEEETLGREHVARLEMAWETEKRRLALAKLKAYFLDKVEVERIVLHSLKPDKAMSVTTFRTAKLPHTVLEELAALRAAQGSGKHQQGSGQQGHGGGLLGAPSGLRTTFKEENAKAQQGSGEATLEDSGRMTKADLRRAARKQREVEWAAFDLTRPDDKAENPADLAAIEAAKKHMGDYKLKSDPSYIIPEEERMNPPRKRLQMLTLEEAMYNIKMEFNRRFLALREVKRKVISEINLKVNRLKDIETQLAGLGGAPAPLAGSPALLSPPGGFPLALRPEEQPETREDVSEKELEQYAQKKAEEEKKATQGSALGGFAGGGAGASAPPASSSVAPSKGATGTAHHHEDSSAAAVAAREALNKAVTPLSDFEKSMQAFQRKKLDHLRSKLTEEVSEMAEAFDEALSALRREKFRLEADIKEAEMRQLVHYQELVLLRDFDKREGVLVQKRQVKLDDKNDIVDKIGECTDKLEAKAVELEGMMGRRAAVIADFEAAVPESDPFREALYKIFVKKIKRMKKKAATDDNDDDEDEEEEEDEDEDEEEEDNDEKETCPTGCEQALYDSVCALRERKLDEDDLISDFQKTVDAVRREKENLSKKQKLVEQSLAAIHQDMVEFQREKQGRLNQIDVVVNLRMHQVEYLVDGRLPDDLSQGLVFGVEELARLKGRIGELDQEKLDLRAHQKALKREHLQLLRDRKAKEGKIGELEARAHDVQMLKFGQVIDLDMLDRVGASHGTEDLKEQLKAQEQRYVRELAAWDKKIASRMEELMAITQENTNCLNAVSDLTLSQRRLESTLTAARTTLFSDSTGQRKQEVEERDQLVQVVNAQAAEIQKIKAQIGALRRKDTSVYQ